MTTLITGGASKIGVQIAQLLKASGRDVFFGSRSGRVPDGFDYVSLDWDAPTTFENAFFAPRLVNNVATKFSTDGPGRNASGMTGRLSEPRRIRAVYLVGPITDIHCAPKIIPFVEMAISYGATRFVYLSATIADRNNDSGGLGELPAYFQDRRIDYVALRPTWFMENLQTDWINEIRENNSITTATPHGRVPLIATEDIARVGFQAIVDEKVSFCRRDPLIIGPELLNYNDVASILSRVLGRTITHKQITFEQMYQGYIDLYGPGYKEAAKWLVDLDRGIESGSEEHYEEQFGEGVIKGTIRLEEWVEKRKHLFLAA